MRLLAAIVLALALAGCAKVPDTGGTVRSRRVIVTLTFAGPVRSDYVYIVGLQPLATPNPTSLGPIPVVAPPWGNGFVTGGCTYFVRWDPAQSPTYLLYRFRDAALTAWFDVGAPINAVEPGPGGRTLRFELDVSQLAPTRAEAEALASLQLNFFSQDRVPQGSSGGKAWDALGNSRLPSDVNQYLTVDLRRNGLFTNERAGGLEPPNDVADPSLDLVDWSVEVRVQ
ncbi:MAG: hypothetical protein N2109_01650 [Fimbriimonadales bacterium]|nr:hypothetical protein [Fimbriimonadales bacterium]